MCRHLVVIDAHTWIQLAHASSSRENCAATYLSRPLCLRFYMRVMFCVKFPSGHPFVSSSPSCMQESERTNDDAESRSPLRKSRAIDNAHSRRLSRAKKISRDRQSSTNGCAMANNCNVNEPSFYPDMHADRHRPPLPPLSFLGIIEYRSCSFFSFLLVLLVALLLFRAPSELTALSSRRDRLYCTRSRRSKLCNDRSWTSLAVRMDGHLIRMEETVANFLNNSRN